MGGGDTHSPSLSVYTLLALLLQARRSNMATFHAVTPKLDRRGVRTRTLLSGWWRWLRWVGETGESNTPPTEGRRRTRLTPAVRERRRELVFLYRSTEQRVSSIHNGSGYLSLQRDALR